LCPILTSFPLPNPTCISLPVASHLSSLVLPSNFFQFLQFILMSL
jgi:hypothetical protein